MRIFYCIDRKEDKYVSETKEIWIIAEDIRYKYGFICFIDSSGTTYKSEKIDYCEAISCLEIIAQKGFLILYNYIFEEVEDEE